MLCFPSPWPPSFFPSLPPSLLPSLLPLLHSLPHSLSCSVANHMGNQQYGDWNNFTFYNPFNQSAHYHPYCLITDFNNQEQVHNAYKHAQLAMQHMYIHMFTCYSRCSEDKFIFSLKNVFPYVYPHIYNWHAYMAWSCDMFNSA